MAKSKTGTTPKTGRLDIRISLAAKRRLERAAALANCSLTEFVERRVCAAAEQVIQKHETLRLAERDRDVFFKALGRPPKPTAALRRAVRRYQQIQS